jgi:eukaryotic-like serine/threonine-protein kinase
MTSELNGNFEPTSSRDPALGAAVLGYVLQKRIGVGGMGIVYHAVEPNIGRSAAVKVLLPEVARDAALVERLIGEARAANAIGDRGIVDIFGFGALPDGRQCIVMELLRGVSLEEELARLKSNGERMPLTRAFTIIEGVASSLQAAHNAGVVHRDLKPSNIFLCRQGDGTEFTKLLDFGIAKLESKLSGNSPKTATNLLMGTPAYMSPEQARGKPASPSMDLYALGVISFELLTGQLPFVADNVVNMLMAHQQDTPPSPSDFAPISPAAEQLVLSLLQKDPLRRPPSTGAVRDEIRNRRLALTTIVENRKHMVEVSTGQRQAQATPFDLAKTSASLSQPSPLVGRRPFEKRRLLAVLALLTTLAAFGIYFALRQANHQEPGTVAADPLTPSSEATVRLIPAPNAPAAPEAPIAPRQPEPTATVLASPIPSQTDAATKTSATANPLLVTRRRLELQIARLQTKLKRAAAQGESVELEQQQLDVVKENFKKAKDVRAFDTIETVLDRLERGN